MPDDKFLEMEIKKLREELEILRKDYLKIYKFLKDDLEKVYTLSSQNVHGYKEIYRHGDVAADSEIPNGWQRQTFSIGYTFKNKLMD